MSGARLLPVLVLCLAGVTLGDKARFDSYRVYTVVPTSQGQLQVLHQLEQQHTENGLSFWKEVSVVGGEVDVMVPPHQEAFFTQLMQQHQIPAKLFVPDVQKLIDQENPNAGLSAGKVMSWTEYYRLADIHSWLDELAASYPEVTVVVAGQSYEGRQVKGVKVSFAEGNPAVFIEGGIHAREWITPAFVTYLLNEVLTSTDPAVRAIAEAYDWHVFPSVNPDGYEYTHTSDRMWRKTRRPNAGSGCVGTDANRNFPTEFWGQEPGASTNPCGETYGGSAPFSEVEMRALSEYMLSVPNLEVYLSFHSYAQVIIYPMGHDNNPVPNRDQLQAIGDRAAAAILQKYHTYYRAGNTVDLMYICNGLTMDWAYKTLGIPIVFSLELRDTGEYGFLLPAYQIVPTSEETLDGVLSILGDALAARKE